MAEDENVGGTHNSCRAVVPAAAAAGNGSGSGVGGEMVVGNSNRFVRQWQRQHSSRIIRVTRASGGKDRHSKVLTAKGARDRRVRLSVTTAIQFYDLQDRLGYDQPSKAVEWLINAAADAINELPSLNTSSFPPEAQEELRDEPRVNPNVVDSDPNLGPNQQQMGSKSGCSSNNSENSKGSGGGGGGLSLSQKEIRNKARERARERTAKDKERDGEPTIVNLCSQHLNQQHQQNVSSMPQTSFTQLLTGRMSNLNDNGNGGDSSSPSPHHGRGSNGNGNGNGDDNGNGNQWLSSAPTTTSMADYFGAGLMSLSSSRVGHQIQLGNNPPQVMTLASFGGSENEQHFPFVSDHHHHHHHHQHLIQVSNATASGVNSNGNDYNLNFTMSSSSTMTPSLTAGFNNRGTLQSNSPLVMPYLQRFSPDGSGGLPFFLGSAAAVSSASPTVENHQHQHHHPFQPPGLQLCYGDNGARHTDHKGKGKNN